MMLFLWSNYSFSQSIDGFKYNWEASPQQSTQRNILDTLQREDILFVLEDLDLYESGYLTADESGNLSFYDFSQERIIYLNTKNPTEISLFSEGFGRGPEEIELARDVRIDKNGKIWIIDLENSKLQRWNNSGELEMSLQGSKKLLRPYRLAICDNQLFILPELYQPEGLYHTFDLEGNFKNSFKEIKADKDFTETAWRTASYFRGDLTCIGDDLVHIGRYKDFIRRYDGNTGDLIFSKKTVEFSGNPEPLLEPIGRRNTKRKDDVKTINGDVEIYKERILISYSGNNRWFHFLDSYDLEGNYIESWKLGRPTLEFTIGGDYLYAFEYNRERKTQQLTKYRLPKM